MSIRMTTKVEWRIDEAEFSKQLGANSSVRSGLNSIAQDIVSDAKGRLSQAATHTPKDPQRYLGKYWSSKPSAVAGLFQVKDTRVFPTTSAKTPGREAPVVLIINDHPYSTAYERGVAGFPRVPALREALKAKAASSPKYRYRKGSK